MERFAFLVTLLLGCSSSIANLVDAQETAASGSLPTWLEGPWKVAKIDVTVGGVDAPDYRLLKTEWMMFTKNEVYCVLRSGWSRIVRRYEFANVYNEDAVTLGRFKEAEGQPDHIPNCRWVVTRVNKPTGETGQSAASIQSDELRGSQESQTPSVIVTSIHYQWRGDSKQVRVEYRLTRCDDSDLIYAATNKRTLARKGGSAIPHLKRLSKQR